MRIPRPNVRRRFVLAIAGVLILTAAGAWYLMADAPASTAVAHAADRAVDDDDVVERVPVELAEVVVTDLPDVFRATGTLEADRSVELTTKLAGQVTHLHVEEGDRVERGQVLLELDHREQELRVEEARVRAETARLEYERIRGMAERGLETDRRLEEAEQAFEVTRAQYELTRVRLDDHFVRAPFSGRLTVRHVELGSTIQAGAPLFGIADTDPMKVELFLPERVVSRLAEGQRVTVRPDVAPDRDLAGTVERIAPVVDAATSTVKVTLHVADPGESVRSGSFVRCRVTTDVRNGVVAVPKKALVAEAGATYLFVADADSVRRVVIETGYHDDEHIEVREGVVAGDRVVVVGQGGLRQGSRIEVLPGPDAAQREDRDATAELARR
ncbi:MAG TPA: efflux RND transporter periplasmic adaptor subunit [Candidatus Krumholzibacteria bacterium]|nr:efflux RND transporter periplasmic adaptor subunit [Candidatus Krumholzibacteria bacterium]